MVDSLFFCIASDSRQWWGRIGAYVTSDPSSTSVFRWKFRFIDVIEKLVVWLVVAVPHDISLFRDTRHKRDPNALARTISRGMRTRCSIDTPVNGCHIRDCSGSRRERDARQIDPFGDVPPSKGCFMNSRMTRRDPARNQSSVVSPMYDCWRAIHWLRNRPEWWIQLNSDEYFSRANYRFFRASCVVDERLVIFLVTSML